MEIFRLHRNAMLSVKFRFGKTEYINFKCLPSKLHYWIPHTFRQNPIEQQPFIEGYQL